MKEIESITAALIEFHDEHDCAHFHDSKNLATAIEAAELKELFLWKTIEESEK
jgi:hypothetical protein